MNQSLSRRQFLKLTGAGAAAVLSGGLTAFSPIAAPAAAAEENGSLYGVCDLCGMGCAFIAQLRYGRIVSLSGNPKDQIAEGKLCVKGYSGVRQVYDPDRLKYPMKRTNPQKGVGVDPGWIKISWDEAIGLVASNLKQARDTNGPQSILFVGRPSSWTKHFTQAIGTPNHVTHVNTCYSTHDVVWQAMVTGTGRSWTTDYEHSRYILAFGWNGMGNSKNHWARAVGRALVNGAKLVVFDPRLSITAAKADEWIPIKPGTDLAVLLAMIRTIINEELYDHDFVGQYTAGFDELKASVQEYTPEWASSISEVPADTIVRIAREFARTKPAVVASHKRDAGGPNYANSWRTSQCFVTLNSLVGSLDRPGGPMLDHKPKLPDLPDLWKVPKYPDSVKGPRVDGLEQFPVAGASRGSFSTLAEGILSQKPNPIKAAVFWKHNVLSFPNPPRLVDALKTIPFIAVSDIMPTEIVQLADMVLPENSYFEGGGIVVREYHAMYPQVALKEALPTLYDTKGFVPVMLAILKKMGLNDYVPEGMDPGKLVDAQIKSLGTSAAEIKGNGGVWGTATEHTPATVFGTPSKKIELYATLLKDKGYDPLPRWAPPQASVSDEYPYHLLIWRKAWERMTQTSNDPVLAEFYPENHVTVHRQTAAKLGLQADGYAWVESPSGNKIRVKVEVTEGIRPDCVAVDHGFGHWSSALSVAYGKGGNDGDLTPNHTVAQQRELGCPAVATMWEDVAVKVYKA